ncbi:MAG: histidine kinase [Bacteroidota bacterium]
MKKHLLIAFSGALIGTLIFYYTIYNEYSTRLWDHLLAGLFGVLLAYQTHWTSRWLDRLLNWQQWPGLRLLVGIVVKSMLCFGTIYLLFSLYQMLLVQEPLTEKQLQSVWTKVLILVFFVMLFYSIIYFALYSYLEYARGQIERIRFEHRQTDLQLKALKAQLSPHFLFNSFNTISALMYSEPQKAEQFVRRLAASYHYTLGSYEQPLVSLEEELSFVRSYCFLLQTRFGEKWQLDVQLPESSAPSQIPPLTIQLLVENAIKHNRLDGQTPLWIKVRQKGKWIEVVNNLTGAPPKVQSLGIGLNNIRARYKLLAGKEIKVSQSQNFVVKLPLIA